MEEFRHYDMLFPELVYDILDYFRGGNSIKPFSEKCISDYCERSRFNSQMPKGEIIQPDVVYRICETLAAKRVVTKIGSKLGLEEISSNYYYSPGNVSYFLQKTPSLLFLLNCKVYGFRYIYNAYKQMVLPVVVKKDGKISMGTCFKLHHGIVTAKHCLETDEVAIGGYSAEKLSQCKVMISTDSEIDLAYIETNEHSLLLSGEAKVLDEVLVMGYPKIPMFFDFCTAERAAISSIPTRGAVAALVDQYISRNIGKLMLVTARIRGGNSGGPIIDSDGAVVGVAFCEPQSEGDYDEMGYGIAYPIHVLNALLQDNVPLKVNFVDKVEV